jgi:histidinol dehydrogenase
VSNAPVPIAKGGSILNLGRLDLEMAARDPAVAAERDRLCRRGVVHDPRVRAAVREIVDDVRARGAAAVREANERVGGGARDGRLLLGPDDLAGATRSVSKETLSALETAINNVRRVAQSGRPATTRTVVRRGVEVERRWVPLGRIGAYVPGGSAPLPSSLVMTVVPAQVAGVEQIVVATPAGPSGEPDPVVLATAAVLGIDRVLVAGGAQAIAALAFGLPEEGLPPADRIVGPGSAWVTAAKLEVAGEIGIDLPAGPSEGMVLAAPPAGPDRIAADLLTQAEHGPDSPALLVTTDAGFADEVEVAVRRRLAGAFRREILEAALSEHGRIVLAPNLDAAVGFVNDYAPEHLSIDLRDQVLEETVNRIQNAGSIFVGPWAPESAGDYATGANHVLPTGGLARSSSPLGVESFGRYSQIQRLTREGLAGLRPTIRALAEAEGLLAHRDAVEARFDEGDRSPAAGGDVDR